MARSRDRSPQRHHHSRRSRSKSPFSKRRSRSHDRARHKSRSPQSRRRDSMKSKSPKRSRSPRRHERSLRRSRSPQRKRSRSPPLKRRSRSRGRKPSQPVSRRRSSSGRQHQKSMSRSPDRRGSGNSRKIQRSRSRERKTSRERRTNTQTVNRRRSQSPRRQQTDGNVYASLSPLLVPYHQPSPEPEPRRQPQYRQMEQQRSLSPPLQRQEIADFSGTGRLDRMRMVSPHLRRQSLSPPRRGRMVADSPVRQPARVPSGGRQFQPEAPMGRHQDKTRFTSDRLYIDGASMANTRKLLSDRVATGVYGRPYRADDNITIGIRRHGPHLRDDPSVQIVRHFDSRTFELNRRSDEGQNPLFDREEIKRFHHDDHLENEVYEERRIISVTPSVTQHKSSHSESRLVERSRSGKQEIRLIAKADPRYESLFRDTSRRDDNYSIDHRIAMKPDDLRNSLMKRHPNDERADARRTIEQRRRSPHDNRRVQSNDRNDRPRKSVLDRLSDERSRTRNTKPFAEGDLPDFSKRPGKYTYEEWKDNPLLIPKNDSYYEHDNREGDRGRDDFRGRGRGRGGFRGTFRGTSRGISRGRGSSRPEYGRRSPERYRSSRKGDTWDHDMYKMIEREDDQKPTSTTAN